MSNITVYLKAERNTEMQTPEVFIKDVAKIRCRDSHIEARIKAIKVHNFTEEKEKKCVISILKIISMIEEACPGVTVESLGENDILVELVDVDKHKGVLQGVKIVTVALVSFFGTAFTIMAFHVDVQIQNVFGIIYQVVMGKESTGLTVLEISYSIGLATGIILFFNHIGGRRITKDPTPIEVAMRNYEEDVDKALIATADREGKVIDVS